MVGGDGLDALALARTVLGQVGGQDPAAAPPTPVPPGSERYELLSLVGEGGMGRVVSARDRQFDRLVAVKELSGAGFSNEALRRFSTEAVVTGNLEHPGIAPVFERGVRDGTPYYVMRLVRGRTLMQAIASTSSLDERLALLPAVVRVAHTLGFAHERGVVHRDVKPENVILGTHGETLLLDWGIAKVRGLTSSDPTDGPTSVGTQTQMGTVMGTPMYMAPEQARGDTDAIDERTDVFALGAMLY